MSTTELAKECQSCSIMQAYYFSTGAGIYASMSEKASNAENAPDIWGAKDTWQEYADIYTRSCLSLEPDHL